MVRVPNRSVERTYAVKENTMKPYPKIESLFKRDDKFKFIEGEYRLPEFEYLADCAWLFTEKLDGTNVRVMWDGEKVRFGGRTDKAQMPVFLYDKLVEMFPVDKFKDYDPMCLYGEGYGARIQKGGGNYIPDGVSFILFDVLIGDWWLKWEDIRDVGNKLGIDVVVAYYEGLVGKPLNEAVKMVKGYLKSAWGNFEAEGIVARPMVDLKTRAGHRVITKIKGKDFA